MSGMSKGSDRVIQSFKDLLVYQKSYEITLEIYKVTTKFPKEELYGLTNQIKRAAYSIPLNIAEGYGKRSSIAEFKRFLMMSIGSNDEIKVLLDLSKDLGFIEIYEYERLYKEYESIGKMLYNLQEKWK